ncbi:MAG: GNAT family N-acetyltransferase, partial [bacterium]|nr:GNAT family N-acetyltransferase [bacterium]
ARLRWFIVGSGYSGTGIGSALMEKALGFCRDAGHGKVFLWTFKGLDTARKIYEKCGFVLADEYEDGAWGNRITHQKFELNLDSLFG